MKSLVCVQGRRYDEDDLTLKKELTRVPYKEPEEWPAGVSDMPPPPKTIKHIFTEIEIEAINIRFFKCAQAMLLGDLPTSGARFP